MAYQRIAEALHTQLEESKILLNMKDGVYYDLQGIGGAIWDLLAEPQSLDQLEAIIRSEFDAPDHVRDDIKGFIDDLVKNGLVTDT